VETLVNFGPCDDWISIPKKNLSLRSLENKYKIVITKMATEIQVLHLNNEDFLIIFLHIFRNMFVD